MISGIHLATALSVMLHMEQEGNGMDTKEVIGRLEGCLSDYENDLRQTISAGILKDRKEYGEDVYMQYSEVRAAADRLSEQQQVIAELVEALEATTNAIAMQLGQLNANRIASNKDVLSKAKGHTKDAE